jgi:hypothetical protein
MLRDRIPTAGREYTMSHPYGGEYTSEDDMMTTHTCDGDRLLAGDRDIIEAYLRESIDRLELATSLPLHLPPEIEKLLMDTASTLKYTLETYIRPAKDRDE